MDFLTVRYDADRHECRYFTFGAAAAILGFGLQARPDSSLVHWADRQAKERLEGLEN